MSCHGVSIVCCTNSRCSVCSCLWPQIQKSSASAPTIAPHYPPVPFHLLQPLLKMSLHLFLGDHPFKILLKPCPSVRRHLPSLCTRGPPPVHELESHLISRCPALQTPLALEENLTTFSIKIPPRRAAWIIKKRAPSTEYTQGRPGILTSWLAPLEKRGNLPFLFCFVSLSKPRNPGSLRRNKEGYIKGQIRLW